MKAIQVTQTGGPEVLDYVDLPDPLPGPGQVLVDVQSIGVNFMDVYNRSGLYPVNLPLVPGGEAAGIVAKVGSGVEEFQVGDLVASASIPESYAEKAVAPADRLVRVPNGVDPQVAAAAMLQGLTAHYLCHSTYPLKPGETALVHAGAGGVGLLLIQMAKMLGATVITTVSTDEKAALAKEAGADHTILYTKQDFAEEVLRITNGEGVPVVYDAVGVTTFDKSLECLRPTGYMVLYGQSSGAVPPISPFTLQRKSLFLTRPGLGHYTATREELLTRTKSIFDWLADGSLKLLIHGTFPLHDAAEAHRQLEGRQTAGKLLLAP